MTDAAVYHSALHPPRERLWPLVAVSLVLHVAFFGFALFYRPAPRPILEQKPIVAKLVRLGEKRPERLLPRKEVEPPATAGPVTPKPPATPEPAPPAAKPPPTPPKPATAALPPPPSPSAKPAKPEKHAAVPPGPRSGAGGTSDRLASILRRNEDAAASSEPVYGDPSGDPYGDSSEGSEGDIYLAQVVQALRASYVLPTTISEAERVRLQATVILYIDEGGRILNHTYEKRSGNGAFDAALERAIAAARLPPPPAEFRRKYRSEGLGVVYRP